MVIPGYDNLTLIGRGGFAQVYRARQEGFDRDVAVKVLLVSLEDDRDRRRFERECAAMGRLTGHPHIVTVLASGVTPAGNPYLTTPFYESGTLADRLRRDGPFSVADTVATGVALAGALELAHTNGILHRDLKPANVLLSSYGEPALADFGIAVIAGEKGELSQVTQAFTITHAPPEILDGRSATEATDVYSLASTLWTMLTGAPPFGDDDGQGIAARVQRVQHEPVPHLAIADAPESLDAVLRRALAKAPEDRPSSARELGEQLRDVQRERGDEVTPLRIGPAGVVPPVAAAGTAASPTGTVAWPHDGEVRWADDALAATPAPVAPPPPPPTSVLPPTSIPPTPIPPTSVLPPAAPVPMAAPVPTPPAPGRRRAAVPLLAAAAVIVVLGLIAAAIAASRSGDDVATSATTSTVTSVPATPSSPPPTAPSTTAAPTTTAAPVPVAAPAGPATAIVPDGAPASVRRAATTAQDGANALATGEWAAARRVIPELAGSSDASLAEAWGALDQSTLVVTDWQESPGGRAGGNGDEEEDDEGPKEKPSTRDDVTVLRLGQVAHERDADGIRTSLYCVTWTVQGSTVVAMADQQVVAAPWRAGAADPATAAAVLTDSCLDL